MLSLNHGVYIIEKGYKKTVCPDGKYFHQNKLFFIFTLIIFSEHSYFLRKSQITPERKQRKKYFLTPFALHWNIQTARKAFIYRLFRNLVRYSNSSHRSLISVNFNSVFATFYCCIRHISRHNFDWHKNCTQNVLIYQSNNLFRNTEIISHYCIRS